ncbi:hypothetical protein AN319_24910 [Salmonella enterica subsp. enterica serovar Heidelberg]|nr:hypothetical protein [Salmonella enterica subsp. enterica serovar Heidelberg]EHD1841482.1 hypothetical protein [Salmonella enterica]
MWLMKTLLTSRCINQRGAGHVTCSDLNAPFKALLDDKDFTRKHQHLSKVLHTWNEVVSQSKP